MPCMGPDLEEARERGSEVAKVWLNNMLEQHGLIDITNPKYKGVFRLPKAEERWEQAKKKFIEAVEELFVEDAANSF